MAFKTRIRSYSYSLRAGIRSYIRSYSHEESEEEDDEEDGKKLDDDGSDYSAKNRRLRRKRREREKMSARELWNRAIPEVKVPRPQHVFFATVDVEALDAGLLQARPLLAALEAAEPSGKDALLGELAGLCAEALGLLRFEPAGSRSALDLEERRETLEKLASF